MAINLDADKLKEKLHYNPDTGIFTWIVSTKGHAKGITAGSQCSKYISIVINGKHYLAHRLAWLYMTGSFPKKYIDHINGNHIDNRFCNLREATHGENIQNSPIRKNNTSGIKGISWHKSKKRWEARICANNKFIHLGYFKILDDAKLVIDDARKKYHQQFARFV